MLARFSSSRSDAIENHGQEARTLEPRPQIIFPLSPWGEGWGEGGLRDVPGRSLLGERTSPCPPDAVVPSPRGPNPGASQPDSALAVRLTKGSTVCRHKLRLAP